MRIGILLGVMPRMLHDVLSEILAAEQDMYVVADGIESSGLVEWVDREQADVVILAVPSGPPPPVAEELLNRFPRLTVIALEDRGQRASIYTLRPMRSRLAEPSGAHLVSAIRRAAVPTPFVASVYDIDGHMLDGPQPAD